MKLKFTAIILCLVALTLSGCFLKKKGNNTSTKTGWKYNDANYGGFTVVNPKKQITGPGLVFIDGGMFVMGRTGENLAFSNDNTPRRVTVNSFYIDETEVRNVDYREYLHWVARIYGASYPNVYRNALPDTMVWRSPLSFNEPMVQTYLRHPSFNEYPVVGVSWLQANDYCSWRTDRVNEINLVKAGVLKMDAENQKDANNFNTDAYLAGQYEGVVDKGIKDLTSKDGKLRNANLSDGMMISQYRLPTEAEWEFAAEGLRGVTFNERITERKLYPWDGSSVRSAKKKTRGQMMANFQRGKGDLMGVSGSLNDGYAMPAPVTSFLPNDYGLYCMAGNVNEWVLDVYRPMTFTDMDEYQPFRGNVYTQMAVDKDGKPLPKDKYGRMKYDTIGYTTRGNFMKGDVRNYKDGDPQSERGYADVSFDDPNSTTLMYNQGSGEDQKGRTSLISDKSRVYKGGSFLDRVYWLSPATRRYLDEDKAASDIGFRCAMSMIGAAKDQSAYKNNKRRKR